MEYLRHRLPMSEGVYTLRVEETENGSLVASVQRALANHTSLEPRAGYYNHYRHRYHDNTLPASTTDIHRVIPRQRSIRDSDISDT